MGTNQLTGTLVLLAALCFFLLVLIVVRRLVTAFFCALGVFPVLIGMGASDRTVAYRALVLLPFLVGAAALMLGCVAAPARPRRTAPPDGERSHVWKRAAPCLAAVAILGSVIHFYLTGTPILSSDIEVQRFADGSGLLGLPSRMYQFGLPLSAAAAVAQAKSEGISPYAHGLTRLVFGAMLLGGLLSGFKSALVAVLVTAVLIVVAAGFSISFKNTRRIMVAVAISAVFAVGVGSRYATYAAPGVIASIQERIVQGTAAGPEVLLVAKGDRLLGSSSLENDFSYFAARYFRIGSGEGTFAFQERVSSVVTHTPLRRDAFLVPITTTAVADTQYDFGLPLGALAMFFLGYALQRTERAATRVSTTDPIRFLGYAAVLLGGYSYVIKGGLIYATLNWFVVYAFFAAICAVTVPASAKRGRSARMRSKLRDRPSPIASAASLDRSTDRPQ